MTKKEQEIEIDSLYYHIIQEYHLSEFEKELKKGDKALKVLYRLMRKEIKKHNAEIKKKMKALWEQGTDD